MQRLPNSFFVRQCLHDCSQADLRWKWVSLMIQKYMQEAARSKTSWHQGVSVLEYIRTWAWTSMCFNFVAVLFQRVNPLTSASAMNILQALNPTLERWHSVNNGSTACIVFEGPGGEYYYHDALFFSIQFLATKDNWSGLPSSFSCSSRSDCPGKRKKTNISS